MNERKIAIKSSDLSRKFSTMNSQNELKWINSVVRTEKRETNTYKVTDLEIEMK